MNMSVEFMKDLDKLPAVVAWSPESGSSPTNNDGSTGVIGGAHLTSGLERGNQHLFEGFLQNISSYRPLVSQEHRTSDTDLERRKKLLSSFCQLSFIELIQPFQEITAEH